MRVISERDMLASVPDRWHEVYANYEGPIHSGRMPVEIETQLRNLSSSATSIDVQEIVGNASWMLRCGECNRENCEVVVEIGYDESVLLVCEECLDRGKRMVICSSMLLKESLGEKIGILHEFGVDETCAHETGQIVREPNGTETITIRINGGKTDRIT